MDLFDLAIKLEQDGAAFYLNLVEKAPNEGIANIFKTLAEDEKKHEAYFTALKDHSPVVAVDSTIIELAKGVFKEVDVEHLNPADDQIPLYQEALAAEQRSIDLYEKIIADLKSEEEKDAVKKVIDEERRHYRVIEEIIRLVSRPHRWVEDAEFGLRDEY